MTCVPFVLWNGRRLLIMFVYCNKVKLLWTQLSEWLTTIIDYDGVFEPQTILFGEENVLINLIILIVKRYIYCVKCSSDDVLSINTVINLIKLHCKIEKKAASMSSNTSKFYLKWEPLHTKLNI